MKNFIVIIILLATNFGNAQGLLSIPKKNELEKAIIHFNDGSSVEGIGRIKTIFTSHEEVIVFKLEETDKDEIWTIEDATGVTIMTEDDITEYKYLKVSRNSFPALYEVVTEGNITLYKKKPSQFYNMSGGGGYTTMNTVSTGFPGMPTLQVPSYTHLPYTPTDPEKVKAIYYLKKKTEEYPTKIKDNYIKATAAYMKDCEPVVEKIKNHEYNYSTLKDLVDYYNANCGD